MQVWPEHKPLTCGFATGHRPKIDFFSILLEAGRKAAISAFVRCKPAGQGLAVSARSPFPTTLLEAGPVGEAEARAAREPESDGNWEQERETTGAATKGFAYPPGSLDSHVRELVQFAAWTGGRRWDQGAACSI